MRLRTPEKIRSLQRKLYLKAKQEPSLEGEGECLRMKVLGKPYSGKLNVRFDEGEQEG